MLLCCALFAVSALPWVEHNYAGMSALQMMKNDKLNMSCRLYFCLHWEIPPPLMGSLATAKIISIRHRRPKLSLCCQKPQSLFTSCRLFATVSRPPSAKCRVKALRAPIHLGRTMGLICSSQFPKYKLVQARPSIC